MKTKKILFYVMVSISLFVLFSNNTFAVNEDSWLITQWWSSIVDFATIWILNGINAIVSFLLWFMAWLMTFWALLLSNIMDLIFIKVQMKIMTNNHQNIPACNIIYIKIKLINKTFILIDSV